MAGSKSKQPKGEARRSPLARRIVERWGEAGGDVALDRVISELGDVQRYDIVASLKELERAGAGEFVAAKAGRKARFVWSAGAARFANDEGRKGAHRKRAPAAANSNAPPRRTAAKGRAPSASLPKRPASSMLEHVFRLRKDVVVAVDLPADVTRVEVERFCQFLRAIPFDRDVG